MNFLYNLLIRLIDLLAPWMRNMNEKTRKGVDGRENWRSRLLESHLIANRLPGQKTMWMHVSSLGEFEQGRPVIEAFRLSYPDWMIVLTFFSPSGYEMRKNYDVPDWVGYLPFDTTSNARDFVQMINPNLVIFVKYDLWPNYIFEIHKARVPLLLIAAHFRKNQIFFRWYGLFWRKMLGCFTQIFVQSESSVDILSKIGIGQVIVCGDTRIDRVAQIAAITKEEPTVGRFVGRSHCLVVGSSWQPDEEIIYHALKSKWLNWKIVIAPHSPWRSDINHLYDLLGNDGIRLSMVEPETDLNLYRWLVVDNIGMLNTLYHYAHVAYIGGGFGSGIHNTLEPAAYNIPVIFGPKYQKFNEAIQMITCKGAFSIHSANELSEVMDQMNSPEKRIEAGMAAGNFIQQGMGGTKAIMLWIKQNS